MDRVNGWLAKCLSQIAKGQDMPMLAPEPLRSRLGQAQRRFAPVPHLRAAHRGETTDLNLLMVRALVMALVPVVWLVAVVWAAEQLF
ncbi:hypothetical protein [Sagittula sp. MA-2]|uniref:hypothetical protein n=1 Tax=Sagittula sp. MA-2 TaxID=3048007 RepID=UPI0024C27E3B|nr:hypothetical protein [Sagittula sp. MA-2]WHZ34354.1 hypothetical protein QNI11_17170 [Sagittula sp. MA-2]